MRVSSWPTGLKIQPGQGCICWESGNLFLLPKKELFAWASRSLIRSLLPTGCNVPWGANSLSPMCPASFSNVLSILYSLSGFPILCLVAQLCPTLCDPMDYIARQAPLSIRILQARILEWVAYSFSRGTSRPRDWTRVSCVAGGFFTSWATRESPLPFLDA